MYETQKDQVEQQSWNMQQAGMMQDNLKSSSLSYTSIIFLWLLPPLLFLPRKYMWAGLAANAFLCLFLFGIMMMLSGAIRADADVMVTVDAMKTTNKELKKQYGKVNIDKSMYHFILAVSFWRPRLMG
jgi:hypothetical protein